MNQLRYVITIAETQNFSNAAKQLYISQPALSQYIKRLEKTLGVELFKRDKSKVEITQAGEIFIEEAKVILEHNDILLNKMKSFSEKSNETLIVGVSQFYGKYFIPNILPKFKEIRPNINIKIHEDESSLLENHILNNKIDLAIMPLPIQSPKVKYKTFYKERILLAINKANSILKDVLDSNDGMLDFSIFKDEKFVLLKKGFKLTNITEKLCAEHGFEPNVVIESENLDTLNSFVSSNIGISLLPDMIQRFDNIEYIEFKSSFSDRSIVIAYKDNEIIPRKISNFIDIFEVIH